MPIATNDSIPSLEEYGIDPIRGFMPNPSPLRILPEYYRPWEDIMKSFNTYLMTGTLRKIVESLPVLEVDSLLTKSEKQRAYTVLTFLAHGYLYGIPGAEPIINILPQSIAVPWFKVSNALNINPVASYSGVGLWNWFLLDENEPINLKNLGSLHLFTGAFDEAWFYLVPLAIEIEGAPALTAIIEAQKATLADDDETVAFNLRIIANCVKGMKTLMEQMYLKCDTAVFWRRTRIYSGGSKNSEFFPDGVFYEGVSEIDRHVDLNIPIPVGRIGTWRKYPGASAGQSPLIHSLDVALGIVHQPMAACPISNGGNGILKKNMAAPNPMLEMREALPGEFQEFIIHLARAPSIRDYCQRSSNEDLKNGFNECCQLMKEYRDSHLRLATTYIVSQTKGHLVGTGGTDLVPFLKQVRAETAATILEASTNGACPVDHHIQPTN